MLYHKHCTRDTSFEAVKSQWPDLGGAKLLSDTQMYGFGPRKRGVRPLIGRCFKHLPIKLNGAVEAGQCRMEFLLQRVVASLLHSIYDLHLLGHLDDFCFPSDDCFESSK